MTLIPANRRGFTIIEFLVGIAVAGFAMAATAQIAQWGFRASNRGVQSTELADRAKLLGDQLRLDFELAGMGSTGAIAAQGVNPWTGLMTTIGGRNALPAVRGVDNVAGTPAFAGAGPLIKENSDVVQVVVPSPADAGRLSSKAIPGNTSLDFSLNPHLLTAQNCLSNMVYIVDSSAPNGAGRAQIARVANFAPATTITLSDQLQFTAEVGAQVMCARVSTYWLDVDGNFRRTDMASAGVAVPIAGGPVRSTGAVAQDMLAPGVEDFQVAYALSAAASGADVDVNNRWVFHGAAEPTHNLDDALPTGTDWFEVRQVRFVLVMRNLRDPAQLSEGGTQIEQGTFLNNPDPVTVEVNRSINIVDSTAALSNLRYFDRLVPNGTNPEPY